MGYLLGKVITDNPGMSVSRWIFGLAPVFVVGAAIAIVKANAHAGFDLSTFLSFPRLNAGGGALLLIAVLAAAIGLSVTFNPFDSIMPIFIGIIISLFLTSVYMVMNNKPIDAIGLLLISFPFITYAEFIVSSTFGISSELITVKTAVILIFTAIWFICNHLIYRNNIVKTKFDALILLFIILTFLSAIFSANIGYSLGRWLFEIIYPLSFYFLVINSVRHEKHIEKFMYYLVAGVFLNLALVLYYFAKYGGGNTLLDRYMLNLNFADGVLIANMLIMVMPVAVAFLVTTQSKGMKALLYMMLILGIAGLVLSFARMAQAITVIGLLAFGLNKKTRKYVLLMIAVGAFVFVFDSEKLNPYMSKYGSMTSLEDVVHASSMEKRYGGWRAALGMVKDHPFTGVGVGRFNQEYANYGVLYYSEWASGYVPMISAHNLYLNYLAETGIPGFVLLLTIFLTILTRGFHLIKNAGSNYVFKFSILISVLVFMANSLVDGITFAYVKEIDKGMVFWSMTAIIMSYGIIEKKDSVRG